MIAQQDPFVKNNPHKYKRQKTPMMESSGVIKQPLQPIKENPVDLSYLKNVKSKVDCWTTRMSVLGPKLPENKDETENTQNDESPHKFNMSPQKSPKEVDCLRESKEILTPHKKNKSEELIKQFQ